MSVDESIKTKHKRKYNWKKNLIKWTLSCVINVFNNIVLSKKCLYTVISLHALLDSEKKEWQIKKVCKQWQKNVKTAIYSANGFYWYSIYLSYFF